MSVFPARIDWTAVLTFRPLFSPCSDMQDPRSVEKLRQGDAVTLKRLFKANYAKLYPMAFRLTCSREAAGEVIRLAFKRLWESRRDLDVFEQIDLRLVRYTYAEAVTYRDANGVTAYATGGAEGKFDEVLSELSQIPPGDLLNYLLFVIDGYTFKELARAYETNVEEIQLSVGRALASLQEKASA